MVQICVACNQKNAHLAEGGPTPIDADRSSQYSNNSASLPSSAPPTHLEQVPMQISNKSSSKPSPMSLPSHLHPALATNSCNPNENISSAAVASNKSSMVHEQSNSALNVRYKVS